MKKKDNLLCIFPKQSQFPTRCNSTFFWNFQNLCNSSLKADPERKTWAPLVSLRSDPKKYKGASRKQGREEKKNPKRSTDDQLPG